MNTELLEYLKKHAPRPNAKPSKIMEFLVGQSQIVINVLKNQKLMKNYPLKKMLKFNSQEQKAEDHERSQNTLSIIKTQPKSLVGGKLRNYQMVSLNWMTSLYQNGLNGILADDMGLGKTIQTIAFFAFLKDKFLINGFHLIVVPKITLGNWQKQFKKWLPSLIVVKLLSTKQERQYLLQNYVIPKKFNVILVSYEGVKSCLKELSSIDWHCIVIDEAHKIKNEETQLALKLRELKTKSKLLLTGTPLQNNIHELWNLLNFIMPQIFYKAESFDNWFNVDSELSMEEKQKKNTEMILKFHTILRPYMLRRTKAQVEKSLPPKKQVHIFVGLTQAQINLYKCILAKTSIGTEKKIYTNLLMQLRKVCNHPYLVEGIEEEQAQVESFIKKSGKLQILDKLLIKLHLENGHKVLIFSQMKRMLDILEDYCYIRGFKYSRIDGETALEERDQKIDEFQSQNSETFIFLLSTKAGGLGITLTAADTVIIYDSDWNPQVDLQAMDRAYRIGQKNMVLVYRLITQNTVQQKMIQRQQVKLKWDNVMIQQSKNSTQNMNLSLTVQEVKNMIQFGAKYTLKATQGTVTDEDIQNILKRGEDKTNQLNERLEEKLKDQKNNLTDFSFNSINIFEFLNDNQKEDEQAIKVLTKKQRQKSYGQSSRRRKIQYFNEFQKNEKIQRFVPQYHFYQEKQTLKRLYQKQLFQGLKLTEEQIKLKSKLLNSGKRNWKKTDFRSFLTASHRYGKNNIKKISKEVGKGFVETQEYHEIFWARIDELSEKDKILKQMIGERNQNKEINQKLLRWKKAEKEEIQLNLNFYGKFKSKLFSYEADRLLLKAAIKHGENNLQKIKQQLQKQNNLRFDLYVQSRSAIELGKRLQVIYKIVEKQYENERKKRNKDKKEVHEVPIDID